MAKPPPKRIQAHDPAIKAQVLAALLAGQRVQDVAAAYHLPEGTVKSWRQRDVKGAMTAVVGAVDKRERIGELLVDFLSSTLETLKKQHVVFGDPEWIRTQDAASLGTLHGIMTDKAIRLLEALGGAGPLPADAEPVDAA